MSDNNNTTGGKKKKFNIFDWFYKDGKDNSALDVNVLEKPSFKNFFKVLWKKLGKLLSANLLFVFGNFPIFFLLLALSGILSKSVSAPLYQSWGPVYGALGFGESSASSALFGILGTHTQTNVINTPTIIFFALSLLLLFTFGPAKVGTTYLYRNMMSGEPVFPFSDFFYVIKRNFKQALIIGIIDVIFIGMFAYNISYLLNGYGASEMNSIMFFFTLIMCAIYSFIRPYAYIMIFTFDLSIGKILKNALYFAFLGIKRNICGLLGVIAVVLINFGIFMIFMPLGALLPFIITFAICDFIGVYTAYPVILKYMVSEEDRNKLIYKTGYDDEDIIDEEITDGASSSEEQTTIKVISNTEDTEALTIEATCENANPPPNEPPDPQINETTES